MDHKCEENMMMLMNFPEIWICKICGKKKEDINKKLDVTINKLN